MLLGLSAYACAADAVLDDPRVVWGLAQLAAAGVPAEAVQITVPNAAASTAERAEAPESYRVRVAGGREIRGADPAGVLYGCLDLAERVRRLGGLPASLDVAEAPCLTLRGTCILLMKLGLYDYPVTPKEFPFFYDKAQWLEYLDFLAANRFNYIAFWNGHPFDYFVRMERILRPRRAWTRRSCSGTTSCSRGSGDEAQKRNIWLMFQFYNIHTSVYFSKAHRLATARHHRANAASGRLHQLLHRAVRQRVPRRRPVRMPRRGPAAGVHRGLDQ